MKLLVVFILTAHALLSVGSAWRESLTYDEVYNIEEGKSILTSSAYKDPYIPPLSKILTGLPIIFGLNSLIPSSLPSRQALPSRAVTTFMSVILVYSIWRVALTWFGEKPAAIALILAAFEPNLLGHNHYLTSDVPFALFFFCAYMVFPRHMFASGLVLGLAMSTKIPALGYFLVSTGVLLMYKKRVSFYWKRVIVLVGISLIIVWATYGFRWDVIIAQREDSLRLSQQLLRFAKEQHVPFVSDIVTFLRTKPVPLGGYIAIVKNSLIRGVSRDRHMWYSMPATILLKTPIPLLTLFFIGLLKRRRLVRLEIPMIVLFVLMSVTNLMPLIRYALPIYPFVILIASTSALFIKTRFQKILFILLLGWYVFGTIIQFPHFISYGNEFAGPRERRFERFTDSNIDWGQSLMDLASYSQRRQPGLVLISYFGRDNAAAYGFPSSVPWGGYTFEDICAFHPVAFPDQGPAITAISISNWYGCGYNTLERFRASRIKDVVGDSILIF
mgnify:CR=1 FL=1